MPPGDHDRDELDLEALVNRFGGRKAHKEKGGKKKKPLGKGGEKQSEALVEGDLRILAETESQKSAELKEDPPVVGSGARASAALEKTVLADDEPVLVTEAKNEKELRDEKIKYLATGLVDDMKVFYGPKETDKREATIRLEKAGVHTVYKSATDQRKDYEYGNTLANKLEDFFVLERGFPSGWSFVERNLKPLGLNNEDLLEARKARYQVSTPPVKEKPRENHEEKPKVPGMDFDEKVKLVKEGGYGGTIFATYKKYIEEGVVPENLENILVQVGKLLPFDVREFAEEWKERQANKENSSTQEVVPMAEAWEKDYEGAKYFHELKLAVGRKEWPAKAKELKEMDEEERKEYLLYARALVKVKASGDTSPEALRLLESKGEILVEMGLMI